MITTHNYPYSHLTLVLLLIATTALSQTAIRGTTNPSTDGIISDTVNSSPNKEFEKRINLSPIDSSSYDLEIRFYKLTSATNKRNLRIVRLAHGEWEALEFQEGAKGKILTHALAPTSGYDTFLINLTKHNFATLPDHKDVEKKIQDSYPSKKEYLASRPSIMDGYSYTVEFKINDKFRVYGFSNPESYLSYYNNVEELKNYVSLSRVFEYDLVRK